MYFILHNFCLYLQFEELLQSTSSLKKEVKKFPYSSIVLFFFDVSLLILFFFFP